MYVSARPLTLYSLLPVNPGRSRQRRAVMSIELTVAELEAEAAATLPARHLMSLFNWGAISATNTALALNVGSVLSSAYAVAPQTIVFSQA